MGAQGDTPERGQKRKGSWDTKSCTEWSRKAATKRQEPEGGGTEAAPPPPAAPTLLRRMLILLPLALHLSDAMAPTPGTSSARFLQLQCTFASLQGGGEGPQCKPKAHRAEQAPASPSPREQKPLLTERGDPQRPSCPHPGVLCGRWEPARLRIQTEFLKVPKVLRPSEQT